MGTDIVWSRYNAMVVADTVLLGFLGSSNEEMLFVPGAIAGIGITVFWWLLTSYGWSLLHAEQPVTDRYVAWRSEFFLGACQDPIWWFAHAVIWLFYFAYAGLLLFYLNRANAACALTGAVVTVVLSVFLLLLWYTLTRLRIRRFECVQGAAQPGAPRNGPSLQNEDRP